MNDNDKKLNPNPNDDTSALFVTARKKQIAEQEAQRQAAEEEAKRLAAEAEVRRLEEEVKARKQAAEEETKRLAEEEEARKEEEKRQAAHPKSAPAAGSEQQTAASKAKKGVIIALCSLGALAIVFIGFLIVFLSADSIVLVQAKAMSPSIDEYNAMSESDRKKAVKAMEKISIDMNFEAVDAKLSGMSGDYPGSAFREAAEVTGFSSDSYLYAEGELVMSDLMKLTPNEYTDYDIGTEMEITELFVDDLIFEEDISSDSNYILIAGEVYQYILDKVSMDDMKMQGGYYRALCKVLGLDGDAMVKKYTEYYAEDGAAAEEDTQDTQEESSEEEEIAEGLMQNDTIFTDTQRGITFEILDTMHVAKGITGDDLEIANIVEFNNCLVMLDITEDYNEAMSEGMSKSSLLQLCVEHIMNNSFDEMYEAAATKLELVAEHEGQGGNELIQTYLISTVIGNVPAYSEIRVVGDTAMFNILFMDDSMDALDDFTQVLSSISVG